MKFELTDQGPQNLLFLARFLVRGLDQTKGLGVLHTQWQKANDPADSFQRSSIFATV